MWVLSSWSPDLQRPSSWQYLLDRAKFIVWCLMHPKIENTESFKYFLQLSWMYWFVPPPQKKMTISNQTLWKVRKIPPPPIINYKFFTVMKISPHIMLVNSCDSFFIVARIMILSRKFIHIVSLLLSRLMQRRGWHTLHSMSCQLCWRWLVSHIDIVSAEMYYPVPHWDHIHCLISINVQ